MMCMVHISMGHAQRHAVGIACPVVRSAITDASQATLIGPSADRERGDEEQVDGVLGPRGERLPGGGDRHDTDL